MWAALQLFSFCLVLWPCKEDNHQSSIVAPGLRQSNLLRCIQTSFTEGYWMRIFILESQILCQCCGHGRLPAGRRGWEVTETYPTTGQKHAATERGIRPAAASHGRLLASHGGQATNSIQPKLGMEGCRPAREAVRVAEDRWSSLGGNAWKTSGFTVVYLGLSHCGGGREKRCRCARRDRRERDKLFFFKVMYGILSI
jgi:hypothetical protein